MPVMATGDFHCPTCGLMVDFEVKVDKISADAGVLTIPKLSRTLSTPCTYAGDERDTRGLRRRKKLKEADTYKAEVLSDDGWGVYVEYFDSLETAKRFVQIHVDSLFAGHFDSAEISFIEIQWEESWDGEVEATLPSLLSAALTQPPPQARTAPSRAILADTSRSIIRLPLLSALPVTPTSPACDQVREMRALTQEGWSRKALGDKYEINPATVSRIVRNIWRQEIAA
jgi:hypothetical protein